MKPTTSYIGAALQMMARRSLGLMALAAAISYSAGCSCKKEDAGIAPIVPVVVTQWDEDAAIAATCRLFVPEGRVGPFLSQGVGIWIEDGSLLTAAHVVVKNETARDIANATVVNDSGSRVQPFRMGWRLEGNTYHDVAYIVPSARRSSSSVVKVAQNVPAPRSRVHAILLSAQRGEHNVSVLEGTFIGESVDRQFFAISGVAVKGDSGGPVFDDQGRIIGIIVSGGAEIGIPFVVWRESWADWFSWQFSYNAQRYQGGFILCSRVWPRR